MNYGYGNTGYGYGGYGNGYGAPYGGGYGGAYGGGYGHNGGFHNPNVYQPQPGQITYGRTGKPKIWKRNWLGQMKLTSSSSDFKKAAGRRGYW